MPNLLHIDKARAQALNMARNWSQHSAVLRMVLVHDLFGCFRVRLWCTQVDLLGGLEKQIRQEAAQLQPYSTPDIEVYDENSGRSDKEFFDEIWDESDPITEKLRLHYRHRNRSAWFVRPRETPWPVYLSEAPPGGSNGPPILAFVSFKGGVGRTTALASFALQRSIAGDKVCVIDFDLDAPGIGTLLSSTPEGGMSSWGVVDYLLESKINKLPLEDYTHVCQRDSLNSGGVPIYIIPAGNIDELYLSKLSRIDLELNAPQELPVLDDLLHEVRETLHPDWILIDSRAGLSAAAGLLLSGAAHLYVLFGTTSEQGFHGLVQMIRRLGHDRLKQGMPQSDCIIVQGMVPEDPRVARNAEKHFAARLDEIFRGYYYAPADSEGSDTRWTMSDIDDAAAPHKSIAIPYRQPLAFFENIDEIATVLCSEASPYQRLAQRIGERFPRSPSEEDE